MSAAMSDVDAFLSLGASAPPNPEKAVAAQALKVINEKIEAELLAMPDDTEALQEDQGIWVGKWTQLLVRG